MKKIFQLLFSLFVFSATMYGQDYSHCWRNINYAGDNKAYHLMDIYLPKVEKESYPAVVLIYGSAWLSNNAKGADMQSLGRALLDYGYAVITPNHRASFDAVFPAQVHDMKAVVRFLRGNANTYKIDDSFIGIVGSSSGGSLAAIMGTSRNTLEKTIGDVTVNIEGNLGGFTSYSSSVDAVVDFFGPTNMLKMDSCGGTDYIHNKADSPASLYIGGPIQENKEKTLLASATTYVDPSDPPFLIFHGDADRVVPHCQSEILYDCLQKSLVESTFHLIPNGQHGPGVHVYGPIKKMVDFFDGVKIKSQTLAVIPKVENRNTYDFKVFQIQKKRSTVLFSCHLPKKEKISISIYGIQGNQIVNYNYGLIPSGLFEKEEKLEKLSPGMYLFSCHVGESISTQKIIIQ